MSMLIDSLLPLRLVSVEPVSICVIVRRSPRKQHIAQQRAEAITMNDVAEEAGRPLHTSGTRGGIPLISEKCFAYVSLIAGKHVCQAHGILQGLARSLRNMLEHRMS